MIHTVILSGNARRQLQKLEKNTQTRIIAVLERIRTRPEAYISKLIGEPGYKLRVGQLPPIRNRGHVECSR